MFDDLAVLQLENVHDGVAPRTRSWDAVNMLDDIIAVSESADDVAVCGGKFVA
jgi:hypothetical protein